MGSRQPFIAKAKFTQEQLDSFYKEVPDEISTPWRSAAYFEEFDKAIPERSVLVSGEDGLFYLTLAGHSKEVCSASLVRAFHNRCEGFTFLCCDGDGEYPKFVEDNYSGEVNLTIEGLCSVTFKEACIEFTSLSSCLGSKITGVVEDVSYGFWKSTATSYD